MSELEGKILGRYELKELIGSGGMAEVYKGYDLESDKEYAIKVLKHEDKHMKTMQRFAQEMEIMRKLSHPHLVPICDSGSDLIGNNTWYYIVMPVLGGGTLQKTMQGSPLPLDSVAMILSDIANALDYIHSKNIIHRDITASNILFDAEGCCYLSDLGIARINDANLLQLTNTGSFMGTPYYVAPELLETDCKADVRSDLYSLGILLFEMVTGRMPFRANNLSALLIIKIKDVPPMPSSIAAAQNLPKDVDDVILRALAKEPGQRYGSARELADAFHNAIVVPVTPGQSLDVQVDIIASSIDADQDAKAPTMQEFSTPVQLPTPRLTKPLEQEPVIPPDPPSTPSQLPTSRPTRPLEQEPMILSNISSTLSRPWDYTDTSPRSSIPSNSPVFSPGAADIPDTPPASTPGTLSSPHRNVLVKILLAVVAFLLIIICVVVIAWASTVTASSNSNATATAGSQAAATRTARTAATTTAITGATATVQAYVQETATAQAQETVIAQQTVTAEETATAGPLATVINGTPVYFDTLNDSSNSTTTAEQWDGADGSNSQCSFNSDGYHVIAPSLKLYACQESANQYGNATISVDVTFLRGGSGGIFLRFPGGGSYNGYLFEIDSTGRFKFSYFGEDPPMQDWTFSPALNRGYQVTNTIAVIMQENTFALYANGQYLTTVTDSNNTITSSATDYLALFASAPDTSTEVVFSNLEVY